MAGRQGTRVVPAMLLYTDETKKVVSADGAAGALRLRPLRYQRDDDAGEHDDGSGLLAIERLPRAQADARQEGARLRAEGKRTTFVERCACGQPAKDA